MHVTRLSLTHASSSFSSFSSPSLPFLICVSQALLLTLPTTWSWSSLWLSLPVLSPNHWWCGSFTFLTSLASLPLQSSPQPCDLALQTSLLSLTSSTSPISPPTKYSSNDDCVFCLCGLAPVMTSYESLSTTWSMLSAWTVKLIKWTLTAHSPQPAERCRRQLNQCQACHLALTLLLNYSINYLSNNYDDLCVAVDDDDNVGVGVTGDVQYVRRRKTMEC